MQFLSAYLSFLIRFSVFSNVKVAICFSKISVGAFCRTVWLTVYAFVSISMDINCANLSRGLYFSFDSLVRILKLAPACSYIKITIHMWAYQCSFVVSIAQIFKGDLYANFFAPTIYRWVQLVQQCSL